MAPGIRRLFLCIRPARNQRPGPIEILITVAVVTITVLANLAAWWQDYRAVRIGVVAISAVLIFWIV